MNRAKIESMQCVKDLGVTIASNLKFSQQWKDATGKANKMMVFINKNFSLKSKNIIPPMHISLLTPLLAYAGQFW